MSYDLFFVSPTIGTHSAEFRQYFAERPNFSVQNDQAWYQNNDTGVYFSFELAAAPSFWAQFIVNYMRPRFFILEALSELESFVSTFDVTVHDPQIEGMGDGRFDSEGFIRGWAAGNETACATLAESGHPRPLGISSDRLEASWRWNLGRGARQAEVGEALFVPQIMLAADAAEARTAVVWTDAIPILLPTVDQVVLYRDAYAPKRFFRRKPDMSVVRWDALATVLSDYHTQSGPVPYRRLVYNSPPAPIATLFTEAVTTSPVGIVAADSILESELLMRIPKWQSAG